MLKSLLLAPLLLSIGHLSYASYPNQLEEFVTSLEVYSLIIGVYILYWLKQKA